MGSGCGVGGGLGDHGGCAYCSFRHGQGMVGARSLADPAVGKFRPFWMERTAAFMGGLDDQEKRHVVMKGDKRRAAPEGGVSSDSLSEDDGSLSKCNRRGEPEHSNPRTATTVTRAARRSASSGQRS